MALLEYDLSRIMCTFGDEVQLCEYRVRLNYPHSINKLWAVENQDEFGVVPL